MDRTKELLRNGSGYLARFLDEIGLSSFYHSTLDTKLLCIQRFVRLFAYGGSTLILVAFLEALGNSKKHIGLFMTLTLVGDTIISLILTLYADTLGRRVILGAGALLMASSGIIFALSDNYLVLLAAAVFGVISPGGNEIGPFRAIEESTLAQLTPPEKRSDIFAWCGLIGLSGSAIGMVVTGWTLDYLQSHGWTVLETYKFSFYAYAGMGMIKVFLALSMSSKVEAEPKTNSRTNEETSPLLGHVEPPTSKARKMFGNLIPQISKESRSILVKLCFLFALDSFASGLAPGAWQTFFFKTKFGLSEGVLGTIFFTTTIVSAFSMLASSSIAKRIGNIKAMVFTHLPSSIALALLALPNQLPIALAFLIFRASTQSMDTVPRSAFLSAVVLPSERTAIMGAVNVAKTSAQSLSPLITGILADHNLFWLAFVLAGSLKASYDILLLLVFVGTKPREEEVIDQAVNAQENVNGSNGTTKPSATTT